MGMLFSLIKKNVKSTIRLYYQTRNIWPVWLLLNTKARSLYRRRAPTLHLAAQKAASDLARTGIAITHLNELFPGEDLLEKYQSCARELEKDAAVKTNKEFLEFFFDETPTLDLENPFVKLGLNDKILGVVNSYMGMFSKFYYLTLNKTIPRGPEAKAVQSMRWHRDPEDTKMVKVFLYLNDVDENAGPFTYIPESHHEGKWGHLFPPEPPRGSLPPAEEVKKMIPESAIKSCVGKAGTIIFCDTRGIHRGGNAVSKERIMLTLCYASRASSWPLRYCYPEGFTKKTLAQLHLSAAAKYALDNFYRIGRKVY